MRSTFELRETLKSEIDKGRSWGDVVQKYYPNGDQAKLRPLLWKVVNKNYDPKNNRLRERLGLVMLKRVEACVQCNEIHFARCPKTDEANLPPKPPPSPRLLYTRTRNAQANEVARSKGYKNWSQMMTAMIELYYLDKKG